MNLHVDRHGQGTDLVLLHGWGLHSGVWDELLPKLGSRFLVHAVDLPGHGYSPPAPDSFEAAVDAIARAIPRNAIVCGWSLGGLIAQALATQHPQAVRKLLLLSTTPCFQQRPDWGLAMAEETLAQFASGLRQDRATTLASFVRLNALHGARSREAIRAFTRKLGERNPPTLASLEASLAWLRRIDLRAHAKRVAAETIVLHGARDMLVPLGAGRWLAAEIPGARMVEIDAAAHLAFFTHAQEFVRVVEALA